MGNGLGNTLAENIFRKEVDDDIVFDIGADLRREAPKLEAPTKASAIKPGEQQPLFLGTLPEIQGKAIGQPQVETPATKLGAAPPINLAVPEIPQIDLSVPEPNFAAAIDAVSGALPGLGVDVTAPELQGDFITSIGDGLNIGQALEGALPEVSVPINAAIDAVSAAIGPISSNAAVRKGDGSRFGEVAIGESGAVLDISTDLESVIKDVTAGTELENVNAREIFNLATDPSKFISDIGAEQGVGLLTNLGLDSVVAADAVSAIINPDDFVKNRGTDAAVNLIQGTSGVKLGDPLTAGVGALIGGGDIKDVGEAVAKTAATQTTVNVVSGVANGIIPGSGLVIQGIARIFGYSCYLSTSAYHYGFICKKDYFKFTHYRLKIQKKELFSTPVWLGYIGLFSGMYKGLIDNKRKASLMYNLVTKWWLLHIKYLQGQGDFSARGWLVTQVLRCACLGYYMLNYKKSRKKKKELSGVNVLGTYKELVNIIERNHAYG